MRQRNILMTGANGFIGKALQRRLLERYDCVVHLFGLPQFDLLEPEMLDLTIKNTPIDTVVHLAAQSRLRYSINNPIRDAENNIMASLHLFDWCVKRRVKNIIYTSSGGARYGDGDYGGKKLFKETDQPHPICPYGISKHVVEMYLRHYKSWHAINSITLCLGNVYGPGDDINNERIITTTINSIKTGKKMILAAGGNVMRDFVYIDDVVNLLEQLSIKDIDYPHDLYNISGDPVMINYVVDEILNIMGKDKKHTGIVDGKFVDGEVHAVALDCSLAKKELNWNPKVSLLEGLKRTVKSYEN